MRTRWLVTGARGQLGSDVAAVLAGADVTALDRVALDLADAAAVDRVVSSWAALAGAGDPRVVLNAAAWTDVDGAEAEEDAALAVNRGGPATLAAACASVGATLVHVSTDYVFAGDRVGGPPYAIDAPTEPIGAYGRTKLAGEQAVRVGLAEHYVVRTAWLYGAMGRNFVKTMARLAATDASPQVVADQVGSPTWSRELAGGLVALATSAAPFGSYHFTAAGETSWYGFARAVFSECGADPDRVRPCTTAQFPRPAARPAYSVLAGDSWSAAGLPPRSHWRDALAAAFAAAGGTLRAG